MEENNYTLEITKEDAEQINEILGTERLNRKEVGETDRAHEVQVLKKKMEYLFIHDPLCELCGDEAVALRDIDINGREYEAEPVCAACAEEADAWAAVDEGEDCHLCGTEEATRVGHLVVHDQQYPNTPVCDECGETCDEYEAELREQGKLLGDSRL